MRKRVLGAIATLGLLLVGCGGGGSVAFVTRDVEATLDTDALILASRDATGTRVPLEPTRRIDRELRALRTQFPALASVHARLDSDPHSVQVAINNDAPWRAIWERGEWRTGVSAVDEALAPLNVASVSRHSGDESRTFFTIRFAQWVRTKAVAFLLYDKDPHISAVSVVPRTDPTEGDMTYEQSQSGVRVTLDDGRIFERRGDTWVQTSQASSAQ